MDWITLVVFVASIPLAGEMARHRNRPSKTWLWIAVAVGPLAPLTLLVLGEAHPAPAN